MLMLQGFLFAFVGMCAGLTGTAISNTLLLLRQKLDPNFKSQNEAPNVPLNAATWAAHMGISSNVRYQVLNGLDMVSHFCLTPQHKESGLSAYSPVQSAMHGALSGLLALPRVPYQVKCVCLHAHSYIAQPGCTFFTCSGLHWLQG